MRPLSLVLLCLCLVPRTAHAAATPPATQPTREQKLEQLLSGSVLKGFAVTGNATEPVEDQYPISRAAPLLGERWLIAAEVEGIPVPLVVPIRWAGDTPVISVTDLKVPGLGTYSARVVIHGDQYAGTWHGGERSGFIWGRIVRAPAGTDSSPEPPKPPAAEQ